MDIRIGIGYDVHQLAPGHELKLGGIVIPHTRGTVGHSDADALIHSIIDAMFGAAGLEDIGTHFPDSDPQYKGIDSKILLRLAHQKISDAGYEIVNLDSTIMLQEPRVKAHISVMRKTLANTLEISEKQISIKATTTEKMGFIGEEKGVAAQAVILLKKL
jgi:2-C-methyl-D-erythritol 2,4-cyclodiphosphate synthase